MSEESEVDDARGEPTSVQDVSDGRIAQSRLDHPVFVSDSIPGRQRRLEDGLEAILSLAGVGLVLLLGVYAQSTTQGVEEDVRAAQRSQPADHAETTPLRFACQCHKDSPDHINQAGKFA